MDDTDSETTLNLTHMVRPALEHDRAGLAAPCLVLLHGRGAGEEDLMGLEAALDPRFTIISVRAPFRFGEGYAWYDRQRADRPDDADLQESLNRLQDFVERLPHVYGVAADQLYLFGFSQGAVVSSALVMVIPAKIKAVVMHSGYTAAHHTGLDLQPDGLVGKPFFLAHGKYDDVIPVTWGRDAQEYLEEVRADVTYREYPIGHAISEESLYDLSEWLTAQLDKAQEPAQ